uniref:BED-type domain-containing protein n=1 Tax=Salarias fasciatus TaxID=181472 RepID=A0A672F911_SALFA
MELSQVEAADAKPPVKKKTTFEGWRYAHYFDYVEQKEKNVTVKCKLCPGNKRLNTAWNTTANLSKHLKTQHGNTKLVARDPSSSREIPDGSTPSKQPRIAFAAKLTTKTEVKKLVASHIVEEMLPISMVESPTFRKILSRINIAGMSTTADIWTKNNKSFMGMTAHCINPTDFSRQKAGIACTWIKGRHTYDVVAGAIEQVHSSYGLSNKVVATVTDNGSNFVKASKVFETPAAASDSEDEGDGVEIEETDEEVTFTDVGEVLSNETDQAEHFTLPPHLRCASHTLNLVTTTDMEKHLTTHQESKAVYRSAFAKCSALWNKASRSTVAAELVEKLCGKKLIVPKVTRWNWFHDAISLITEFLMTKLITLCSQLGVKAIVEKEYQFLKEYVTVTEPLCKALDKLQGEDYCYYDCLLPTLESLMSKTLAKRAGLSRMTAGLPDVIAVKTRFAPVMDSRDVLLAAVTLPKFKVRWLKEESEDRREALKCRGFPVDVPLQPTNASSSEEDEFFEFVEEDPPSFNLDKQVIDYLKSGKEMGVLNSFPTIKKISLKYNTPAASSAPVERLFSLGSLVLTPKRNRLSDKRFERLLLMRHNHYFSEI